MKSGAEKSSATTSTPATQAAQQPFFAKKGEGGFFAPAGPTPSPSLQTKPAVSKPGDKLEQEADKMADKVMRMPSPAAPAKEEKLQRQADERLQKAPAPSEKAGKKEEEKLQRATAGDERLQRKEEEKLQKAPAGDERLQRKEKDKLQKAATGDERLQRKEEDKLQKAAAGEERLQRKEEDKLQKATAGDERLQRKEDDKLKKASTGEERLQRKEEDKLQKAAPADERLQRKESDGASAAAAGVESAVRSGAAGGEPLSGEVRNFMEPRFGADFGGVRIHNDAESAGLGSQLEARAFTYQNHVFFSRDQYQPGTGEGKQLLAHELSHTVQQNPALQRQAKTTAPEKREEPAPTIQKAPKAAAKEAVTSSGVVDLSSVVFSPSQKITEEIEAQKYKGLEVRVVVKGLTGEGRVKIRADRKKKFDSVGQGTMPLLNPWTQQLGGMHVNFTVKDSQIVRGFASLKPGGGDANDWLQSLKKNAAVLGGLGLKVENLPKPVNKFEGGRLTLGVSNMKVEIGGLVDAVFSIALENNDKPKIEASTEINVKGMVKGQLKLDNTKDKLGGQLSLAVDFKSFSGAATVKYNPDGTIDIGGKAAYNADKLSGSIDFVSTDLDTANKFAKDAIAAAGGKENVQNAPPPAPVPVPKPGKKQRALAATGLLAFNLTTWFAGTVNVVVDGKGQVTVIGKIAPPGEIELFKQRDWEKEIIKLEAKAYYGIPVVGNLNLFANIGLYAIAKLGPAKIYNIEILGTYSTDPEVQKSIQISGSINISAYGGLRLRAEGGAGIEIASHDLKFGIGINADVGVKAYADARPTIGYRDPGVFFISGTLDIVAQPMLGLSGDFFIALETPWWSPLSDDRWTWPLFSKEWPLGDTIGISAAMKEYELGSKKAPEIELKKPEFDPGKMMTKMVDNDLPNKSGGKGAGKGAFKDDGTVPKPVVPPKKPEPKKVDAKPTKKGAPAKGGKSAVPDPKGAKEQATGKIFQSAAKPLSALKGKAPFSRPVLNDELGKIKAQVKGIDFDVQLKGTKWVVTPKAGGKTGKGLDLAAKDIGKEDAAPGGVSQDPEERSKRGLQAAAAVIDKFAGSEVGEEVLTPLLKEIQVRYKFLTLEVVPDVDLWDVAGSMSLKKSANTKAKNPIHIYKTILAALGLPAINEKNAKKYRQKMRAAIVAKYKGNLTGLNTDVLVSSIIPVAQNRIRGDIFEEWLVDNQVMDKPSPIFVNNNLYKKRIADGIKGSSLVDAKVRQPNVGPSASDIEQMEDYNYIIDHGIKAINKNVTFRGPFVKVVYIFNDKSVIPFWRSALVTNLKGNYTTI